MCKPAILNEVPLLWLQLVNILIKTKVRKMQRHTRQLTTPANSLKDMLQDPKGTVYL